MHPSLFEGSMWVKLQNKIRKYGFAKNFGFYRKNSLKIRYLVQMFEKMNPFQIFHTSSKSTNCLLILNNIPHEEEWQDISSNYYLRSEINESIADELKSRLTDSLINDFK